jgi:hypothetical protein
MAQSKAKLHRVPLIVVGAVLSVVALLIGVGALLPRRWHVTESIMINAPAPAIHAWVGDLRHWPEWAQWNQTDLAPRNTLSAESTGAGASLTWYGRADRRGDAASGTVRIVRSDPELGVWFESISSGQPSDASVTFVQRSLVTEVRWEDRGRLPPIVGGLFLDLFQQRLHEHMSKGLERLKALVEHPSEHTPGERTSGEQPWAPSPAR